MPNKTIFQISGSYFSTIFNPNFNSEGLYSIQRCLNSIRSVLIQFGDDWIQFSCLTLGRDQGCLAIVVVVNSYHCTIKNILLCFRC